MKRSLLPRVHRPRPHRAAAHLQVACEPEFVTGPSLRSRALGLGMRRTVRPVMGLWASLPVDVFPPALLEQAARLLPVAAGTAWRAVPLADCAAEWVQADGVADCPAASPRAVLYLHGGAFLAGGLNSHRPLVARLSAELGQPVLQVGYCQMPHQPLSHTVQDCLEALQWLREQGYRTEDVTIAGDSAGGYLAFCVARAAIDAGWGTPAALVAMSPLLELDPARKLAHPNAHTCDTFPARAVARLTAVADRLDVRHQVTASRVCPVDMPLDDMPPTMIHVGSREVLRADSELMANRLVAAGVPCRLQVWERQVHVFQAAGDWLPEARRALAEIGDFVRGLEREVRRPVLRTVEPAGRRSARPAVVRPSLVPQTAHAG